MARTRAALRREHVAGGTFLLMTAAFALAPVRGESPSPDGLGASPATSPAPVASAGASGAPPSAGPSTAPSGAPAASPPGSLPPGGVTPLPARIVAGDCDEPGEERLQLRGPIAGSEDGNVPDRPVYASISQVDGDLASVLADGGVIVVGGDPGHPDAAVVCGSLDAPQQGDADLAIALDATNASGYAGTAMLHEADGAVTITLVVVAPTPDEIAERSPGPGSSPAGSPSASMPVTSPGTSDAPTTPSPAPSGPVASGAVQTALPGALTSPVPRPSIEPGTSGAPPFSPLPQAGTPAPGG